VAGILVLTGCVEKNPDAPVEGRKPLSRAEKRRVAQNILKKPPAKLRYRVNGNLGGKVIYLGLHTPRKRLIPGKSFPVIHYFKVLQPMPGWKLFVHTNGPKKSDFRNFDHTPVFGLHPVARWKPGQIVRDRHTIRLPPNTAYSHVRLFVGIWRGRQRLEVRSGKSDGENRLLAARIPVGKRQGTNRTRPAARGAAERPARYVVRRARGAITVDGRADEPAWKQAPATAPWRDSLEGEPKEPRTEAKLLWDDQHLYVFFKAADKDVWAQVTKRDDPKLWTEQAFELLLDADGNGATYVELQVNPRGVVFDAYLPRKGQTQAGWQSGAKVEAVVDGTLDKRDDEDRGWQVELALPWSAVRGRDTTPLRLPPRVGDRFRANLFRTDRPRQGKLQAWAWSPPRRSTFHALDRFGTLVFGDAHGRIDVKAEGQTDAPAQGGDTARPAARRAAARRPAARRAAARRPAARRAAARRPATRRPAARRPATRRPAARRAAGGTP
jgi:hypothetical protein